MKNLDTWSLMKKVANKGELKELEKIEEKNMNPKDKKSYIVSKASFDAQIQAARVDANNALRRIATLREEVLPPTKTQTNSVANEGLARIIQQYDLKNMQSNLKSSPKVIKWK